MTIVKGRKMPLIPEQQVVSVGVSPGGEDKAISALLKELESYPPVRIVAIASRGIKNPLGAGDIGLRLTAVVETV